VTLALAKRRLASLMVHLADTPWDERPAGIWDEAVDALLAAIDACDSTVEDAREALDLAWHAFNRGDRLSSPGELDAVRDGVRAMGRVAA
jgi:hypothetical protein